MYAVVNNYLCNYVSEQRYVNCVELNVDKMPRHKVSNATYVQRVLSWKNYITKSSLWYQGLNITMGHYTHPLICNRNLIHAIFTTTGPPIPSSNYIPPCNKIFSSDKTYKTLLQSSFTLYPRWNAYFHIEHITTPHHCRLDSSWAW